MKGSFVMTTNKGCFVLAILFYIIFILSMSCSALNVTLAWDANSEEDLEGYRIFYRQDGQNYDYDNPAWQGAAITCTISDLDDNTTYHFVARAYDTSDNESTDSDEVTSVYLVYPTNILLADMSADNFYGYLDRRAVDQPFTVCWDLCSGAIKYELKIAHYFYDGLETNSVETFNNCYTFPNLPKSSRHFEIKIRAVYSEGYSSWSSSADNGSSKNWLIYSKPATPSW